MLVAFDMLGTLAGTASVARELAQYCGDMAGRLARTWRDKQLEYMFRVTAMGQFPPFADLTRWGLARALAESGITLAPAQQDAMAGAYRRLRPFDDARPALAALRERGHSIVVFSVGPRATRGPARNTADGSPNSTPTSPRRSNGTTPNEPAGCAPKKTSSSTNLLQQPVSAVGPLGSEAERARLNVTRAIRSAISRIRDHAPDAAAHLHQTIRTGSRCSYSHARTEHA